VRCDLVPGRRGSTGWRATMPLDKVLQLINLIRCDQPYYLEAKHKVLGPWHGPSILERLGALYVVHALCSVARARQQKAQPCTHVLWRGQRRKWVGNTWHVVSHKVPRHRSQTRPLPRPWRAVGRRTGWPGQHDGGRTTATAVSACTVINRTMHPLPGIL
jgi:hypothetical protein